MKIMNNIVVNVDTLMLMFRGIKQNYLNINNVLLNKCAIKVNVVCHDIWHRKFYIVASL